MSSSPDICRGLIVVEIQLRNNNSSYAALKDPSSFIKSQIFTVKLCVNCTLQLQTFEPNYNCGWIDRELANLNIHKQKNIYWKIITTQLQTHNNGGG